MAVKDNLGGGMKVNGFDYTLSSRTSIAIGEPVFCDSSNVSISDLVTTYPDNEKPLACVVVITGCVLAIYPGTKEGCIKTKLLSLSDKTFRWFPIKVQDNIQITSTPGVVFGSARALTTTDANGLKYVTITVKDKRHNSPGSINHTYNTMYVIILGVNLRTNSVSRTHPVFTYPLQTSSVENFYPIKICGAGTNVMVVWKGTYWANNTSTDYVGAFAFTISYTSGSESITAHGKATTSIATGSRGNDIFVYSSPNNPSRCIFIVTPEYTSSSTDYDTCQIYGVDIANFKGTFTATASNLWSTGERANFNNYYGMPDGSIVVRYSGSSKTYYVINSAGTLTASRVDPIDIPKYALALHYMYGECNATIHIGNFITWKARAWSNENKQYLTGLTYTKNVVHGIKDHYTGICKPILFTDKEMYAFYDSSDVTKIKKITFPFLIRKMTASTMLDADTNIGICKNSQQIRFIK